MQPLPVIVILDIGKTNKKILVFDRDYKVITEESVQLEETVDDDGYPCEDVHLLTNWIRNSFARLVASQDMDVKAINISAYGASFVHLGIDGKPVAPLYNYLKPLPAGIAEQFHRAYKDIRTSTASPDLGNLNSGMQLYMIKKSKPAAFARIAASLHLPQYASFVINGRQFSDLPSLGCHTALWDFGLSDYHDWVDTEGLRAKFAPLAPSDTTIEIVHSGKIIYSGIGLHDSSAALIPYLATRSEEFCLISTGTWCITLNPFNHLPLTESELAQDCLCYLSYLGEPVKAARLFSGHFHDAQVKEIASYFKPPAGEAFYRDLAPASIVEYAGKYPIRNIDLPFEVFDVSKFPGWEAAYLYLIEELVARQVRSTRLVLGSVKNIYVDGGFSMNTLFMTLLARAFPDCSVLIATVKQASSLGAALAIHKAWNKAEINPDILMLQTVRP